MSIKTWEERVTLPESKLDADDCTLAEIAELRAEVLRLQGEVSNRNLRALEGDRSKTAFNSLYDSHEGLLGELRECKKLLDQVLQDRRNIAVELAAVSEAKMSSWIEQQRVINRLRAELAAIKQQKSIGSLKVLKPGEAIATAIEQSVCAFPECCPEHIHLVNR